MRKEGKRRGMLVFLLALGMCFMFSGTQAEAKSKVSYKKVSQTKTWKDTDGTVLVKATYKSVRFKGKSSAVKKMNATLEKERKAFFKMAGKEKSGAKESRETFDWDFYPTTFNISEKVTFNKKGIVSVREMNDSYYSGAAHGYGYTAGHTFSLKTGKQLNLNQVIAGSNKTDKNKLVTAFKKMYYKEPNRFFGDAIDTVRSDNMKKRPFYLSGKSAVACYGAYELNCYAAGECRVRVRHKYN